MGRQERYAFAHALIGQALYEEVPRHRLRRLHLRAGEALERMRGDHPEAAAELARHFLAAGEDGAAGPLHHRWPATTRPGSYAHAEAVHHYRRPWRCWRRRRQIGAARVREKLGVELRVLGRYDEALAALEQAAQAWRAAGELESLGRVVRQIGWAYVANGAPEEGIRRVQSLLPEVEGLGPSATLAALYETLAWAFWQSGQYAEALPTAERTAAMARTLGDTRMVARANVLQGNVLALLGRVKEGLDATEAAIPPAEAAKDLESLSCALGNVAYIVLLQG